MTDLEQKENFIIDYAFEMLMKGVTKVNTILHFKNKGFSEKLAKDIVRAASVRYEEFSHYKAK